MSRLIGKGCRKALGGKWKSEVEGRGKQKVQSRGDHLGTLRGFQGALLGTSKGLRGTFQSCPTRGQGGYGVLSTISLLPLAQVPPDASTARHCGLSCHFPAALLQPCTTLGQTGRAGAVRSPYRTAIARRGVGRGAAVTPTSVVLSLFTSMCGL